MKTTRMSTVRAFRGVRISQKALLRVDELLERQRRRILEELGEFKRSLQATVPEQERVAQYNAGYSRAVADLFNYFPTCSGMVRWRVDGRDVVPGPDGRLTLEARHAE